MKWHLILVAALSVLREAIAEEIDPGIPCKDTIDCTAVFAELKDAICRNGFCICKVGNEIRNCSSAEIIRRNGKPLGSLIHRPCKHDQDCNFRRGVCNTTISQCECQKNYVASVEKQACLQKATSIDSGCIDEKQCLAFLGNTTCTDGKCSCATGRYFVKDTCYRRIDFGSSCEKSEECGHVEDAVCTDKGVCGCDDRSVINLERTKCLPIVESINGGCAEDGQCSTKLSYALCINGRCQCRFGYHYEEGVQKCFASKGLNEGCEDSLECYQEPDEADSSDKPVKCENNTCTCVDDYLEISGRCVNAASSSTMAVPFLLFIILLSV